jgi:hypothetical protein
VNKKLNFVMDEEKELSRAFNIMNSLLGPIQGKIQSNMAPPKPQVNSKPLTDGNDFSNQSTDLEKSLGDKTMHEGDSKPTPESGNRTDAPGASPSGGYRARDGTLWPTKEAKGGHERLMGGGSKQGGAMGGPGMDPMGMPALEKKDYKSAIKVMRKYKMSEPYILDAIEEILEEMDESAENDIKDPVLQQDPKSGLVKNE